VASRNLQQQAEHLFYCFTLIILLRRPWAVSWLLVASKSLQQQAEQELNIVLLDGGGLRVWAGRVGPPFAAGSHKPSTAGQVGALC